MKKLISLFMSIVLLFSIGAEAFAAYTEDRASTYETGNCAVTYTVQNEWDSFQQISMAITNNCSETVRNRALKFDGRGEITNIWNAEVCLNDGEIIVLRSCGYNYEIIPNASVFSKITDITSTDKSENSEDNIEVQVMILTENMAAFSNESNISDSMNMQSSTDSLAFADQLLVETQAS